MKPKVEDLTLPSNLKLYSLYERFMDWGFGCNHKWWFPYRNKDIGYPQPYDAHQTCNKCGGTRFYQFGGDTIFIGPMFRVQVNNGLKEK